MQRRRAEEGILGPGEFLGPARDDFAASGTMLPNHLTQHTIIYIVNVLFQNQ